MDGHAIDIEITPVKDAVTRSLEDRPRSFAGLGMEPRDAARPRLLLKRCEKCSCDAFARKIRIAIEHVDMAVGFKVAKGNRPSIRTSAMKVVRPSV